MKLRQGLRSSETLSTPQTPIDTTLSGALILNEDPLQPEQAATKRYVDLRAGSLNASDISGGLISTSTLPGFSGAVSNTAGSNVFTLNRAPISSGVFTKTKADTNGFVIGGAQLSDLDIPQLSWSKVTGVKPSKLAGYGISDALRVDGGAVGSGVKILGTPSDPLHLVTKTNADLFINTNYENTPVGTVIRSTVGTTPMGYLRCNGSYVEKVTYPNLYSVIGEKYSLGNYSLGNGLPWMFQDKIYTGNKSNGNLSRVSGMDTLATHTTTEGTEVFSIKNRIYLFEGPTRVGRYCDIASNGNNSTFTEFTEENTLPVGPINHFLTKNRINAITGDGTHFYAVINPDLSYGRWIESENNINLKLNLIHNVVIFKGYVYVFVRGSNLYYYSPVYRDGTIGAWKTGRVPYVLPNSSSVMIIPLGENLISLFSKTIARFSANGDGTLSFNGENLITRKSGVDCAFFTTNNEIWLIGGYGAPYIERLVFNVSGNYVETINLGTLPRVYLFSNLVLQFAKAVFVNGFVFFVGGTDRSGETRHNVRSAWRMSLSGASDDHFKYYDGTIDVLEENKYRLPDYSERELLDNNSAYYIKY